MLNTGNDRYCALITITMMAISGASLAAGFNEAKTSDQATQASCKKQASNFAVNGDVENGLANWGRTSGNLSQSTSERHSGRASAKITNRSAGWHGLTFNVGPLVQGNEYRVAVWVKLAPGAGDTSMTLTAKRVDDGDNGSFNEYTSVATSAVSAAYWTRIEGYYTQAGTDFEHFIIEAKGAPTVSYYADDFSITGDSVVVEPPPQSNVDFFVGNITTSGSVRSDFVQHWDQLTPENEGKWGSVEQSRDRYNWSGLDAAYQYAQNNGLPFKQHTFVWGSQYPNWINNLSAQEQAAEIEEWIKDYCQRYPNTEMIDVVNEATPGHAPAEFAKKAFGDDWIIDSFKLARKYCPNAELILNDYNVLSWHTEQFIAMAKPAVDAGLVDAIGAQAHGLENFSAAQLQAALHRLDQALGLPIYISEYDVDKSNDQEQLAIYQAQFPVFYNHASVKGITLWGYVLGRTWRSGTGLIKEDGTQRPAMTWLMNYLRTNPKH